MKAESDFNPMAISKAGAVGLMQLIPATQRRFGVQDPFDPVENITGGTAYLAWLLDEFENNIEYAVAAYNSVGESGRSAPVTGTTSSGEVPQVTSGGIAPASRTTSRSYLAPGSEGSVFQ